MAIWIVNIRIQDRVFRYFDPPSGTWIEFAHGIDGQLLITAVLFDSNGDRFAIDAAATPRRRFSRDQGGATVSLTPLPAGRLRDPNQPPTGEADFLLEMTSYNSTGERVFEISEHHARVEEGQVMAMFDDPDDPRFARPTGMLE